ncbi:MAG: bifunctional hydroxymethylpyrimidine kinase/phosphomethylpyrimidine kinase [Rhodospirillaceae bacterium]|jgi:hydroxymethylpyrimidine/phosphomethylpyrimidine kinase|nr:bifunctional hydroxymethylpyrimidine kinase/phosphomethylpyrimidine kinase [Rhodospirillaceae bacterium]MBT5457274.1 bifunctional hydroxymethylpyrimidine kinase/phosphomethylpyrimidine kinase [Rhodospirillaceae bacterium]
MSGRVSGQVLIVAGSDSGGGAGIQADIKAVSALGAYAMTAISALTAQNTLGVQGVYPIPTDFIEQQIDSVLTDLGADCVKTGMLHESAVIETVVAALDRLAPHVPVVVDPVMVAKGGASLLQDEAIETLRTRLVPRATVLTPNVPEAEALSGMTATDEASLDHMAEVLLSLGPQAVLLKGGHREGDIVRDRLVTADGTRIFENPRIDTMHTHGTGCTLASSIAAGIAQGLSLADAVERAEAYLHEAIRTAPGLGGGHGPVNHLHTVGDFRAL